MPFSKILFAVIVLFFVSCNSDSEVKSRYLKKNNSKKVTKKSSSSCLEKHASHPSKILDLTKVAAIAGVSETELELIPADQKFSAKVCKYTWSTSRKTTMKVGANSMEMEVSNDILIGLIDVLDGEKSRIKPPYDEWFKNAHRQMTEEEVNTLKESANKKLKENAGADTEVGMLLLDGIVDLGKKDVYIDVEGIGDLASARISGMNSDIYLDVLHKNLTFRVVVKVSNDKHENFELAKKIGKEIMTLCE